MSEDLRITNNEKLFSGTSQSHIEFAVHRDSIVVRESTFGKEIQLFRMLNRRAVDDNITLATLKAFDGVNGDREQRRIVHPS